MSLDFSISSLAPLTPLDTSTGMTDVHDKARIQKVARAVEGLFAGQLMAELGKGMSGTSDAKESSFYQDFIQQAMSQEVVKGGGFGLAHVIENYMNKTNAGTSSASKEISPTLRRGIE